ncbi:MAG: hypothetical protein CM15mP65_02870 [Crocinitomicaceae bacterium]|nr:MAG: hypothetical protein CM15mP65_02870 [Crocinitomicaceae bacterium]
MILTQQLEGSMENNTTGIENTAFGFLKTLRIISREITTWQLGVNPLLMKKQIITLQWDVQYGSKMGFTKQLWVSV